MPAISKLFRFVVIVLVIGELSSCTKNKQDSTTTPVATNASSFSLIQTRIMATNCAVSGCHASQSDGTFQEHGLVLAKDVAYQNLFGVTPKNQAAKDDGLMRVKAFKSEESLLYQKLYTAEAHHPGKSYGSLMPLGGTPLTVGQIEFVRRWIEAGAPQTGMVVDTTLLNDKTPSVTTIFTPLEAPAAGTGYQLKVDIFPVNPNFERELFVHRKVNNPTEIYVNRLVLKSRPNSHHLVVYDFRDRTTLPAMDQVRDLRNPDNSLNLTTALTMSNHIFMAGGTLANQEYIFPEGMALKFPANYSVDLNPHYFNRTNEVLYGENYVNLYTVDKSKVVNVVQMLDLQNTSLNIPAQARLTFTKSFTFDKNRSIVMLTSHNHQLGEKFVIKIVGGDRDGEVIYESTDWEHPLIKNFTPALVLKKGQGLKSEITYFNTTNKTVTFGLTSTDEMGIIFGYYYE